MAESVPEACREGVRQQRGNSGEGGGGGCEADDARDGQTDRQTGVVCTDVVPKKKTKRWCCRRRRRRRRRRRSPSPPPPPPPPPIIPKQIASHPTRDTADNREQASGVTFLLHAVKIERAGPVVCKHRFSFPADAQSRWLPLLHFSSRFFVSLSPYPPSLSHHARQPASLPSAAVEPPPSPAGVYSLAGPSLSPAPLPGLARPCPPANTCCCLLALALAVALAQVSGGAKRTNPGYPPTQKICQR